MKRKLLMTLVTLVACYFVSAWLIDVVVENNRVLVNGTSVDDVPAQLKGGFATLFLILGNLSVLGWILALWVPSSSWGEGEDGSS